MTRFMASDTLPSMVAPKGTLKRVEALHRGTTRTQTSVIRDAMLVGLRVFELDGYHAPQIPKGKRK